MEKFRKYMSALGRVVLDCQKSDASYWMVCLGFRFLLLRPIEKMSRGMEGWE